MNKSLSLVFAILLLFLVACGNDDASTNADKEDSITSSGETEDDSSSAEKQAEWMEEQETNDEETNSDEFNDETGEGYVEGLGHVKITGIGYNDEVGIDGTDAALKPIEMGDMRLTISHIEVAEIEPDEDVKELYFDNQEKVKAIVVDMETENTSDEDIEFYPEYSIMVTNTGEQLESDMFLSGDAGGEFFGKVKKEGQAWWILKYPDSDITSTKMIINPPSRMNDWESISEEKRIEFEILSFEEAQKRDSN